MGKSSFAIKFSVVTASLGIFALGAALLAVLWLPNKDERLSNLSSMATTVGTVVAIVALSVAALGGVFAAKQLQMSRKIASADFDFRLSQRVRDFDDVDRRLKEGWPDGKAGPDTPKEWYTVKRYMGLLESIQGLVDDGIIKLDKVDADYSHRIFAIVNNPIIYQEEIVKNPIQWGVFIKLWRSLEERPVYRCESSRIVKNQTPPQEL